MYIYHVHTYVYVLIVYQEVKKKDNAWFETVFQYKSVKNLNVDNKTF